MFFNKISCYWGIIRCKSIIKIYDVKHFILEWYLINKLKLISSLKLKIYN